MASFAGGGGRYIEDSGVGSNSGSGVATNMTPRWTLFMCFPNSSLVLTTFTHNGQIISELTCFVSMCCDKSDLVAKVLPPHGRQIHFPAFPDLFFIIVAISLSISSSSAMDRKKDS
jgi:hypothetical protein